MSDTRDRTDPFDPEILERLVAVRRWRRAVTDVDYWRALYPDFRITDHPFHVLGQPYPLARDEANRNLEQIRSEGYFQTRPLVPKEIRDRLRSCIEAVVAAGHDAVYALVYDEFYEVMGRLGDVLSPVLGDGFQLVPDEYWAFYVPCQDSATGSRAHRDSLRQPDSVRPDGTPALVNVWIPLTDATTLNSCIYVLPAHLDPGYPRHDGKAPALSGAPGPESQGIPDLRDIRAVPAEAGSIVCWSTHLLHWGARSSRRAQEPRISFAVYFQSRHVAPFHEATMDIPSPLPFERRLRLIEKVFRKAGALPE